MARLPNPWRSLTGAVREQQREQRDAMRRSPYFQSGQTVSGTGQTQVGSVTIPDTGTLTVDGGVVRMLDQAGGSIELFSLGVQQYGDRGVSWHRLDGTLALEIRKAFSAGDASQVLRIIDRQGHTIAGDSTLAFSGFDAPHIPMPWQQSNLTAAMTRAQATSSGTFVSLFEHIGFRQNPALALQVWAWCSDATTAGQVQIWDANASVYLGGFLGSPAVQTLSIPAGTTSATLLTLGTVVVPGAMSDPISLQLHAKRTAGTGTVNVAVARSIGAGF